MAEAVSSVFNPAQLVGGVTPAITQRLAQLKSASPARHLSVPPPPRRTAPRIAPPGGTVTLRVARIRSADDWCTSVVDWLQEVVNWINPILSWFGTVLSWLSAIAWFLNLIGIGAWLSAVVSWLQSWVQDLQGWVADIQDVINWIKANGCAAQWVQDFINEVEQLEQDLVGAYNWLVSAINWIEGLF